MRYEIQLNEKISRLELLIEKTKEYTSGYNNKILNELLELMRKELDSINNFLELENDN